MFELIYEEKKIFFELFYLSLRKSNENFQKLMTELYFLFPAETTRFITNIYFLVVPFLSSSNT